MNKFLLGAAAYVAGTFPLGYLWHLTVFQGYYQGLQVYRDDVAIPLGLGAILTQAIVWSVLYGRLFAGEPVLRGAVKFAALAGPLAWSFMALAAGAKHHMNSVGGFLLIETAFIVVHHAAVSPLIAWVYAKPISD